MADERTGAAERQTPQGQRGMERAPRQTSSSVARWRDPFDIFGAGPFALMRRMQDDFDRMLGSFGVGQTFPDVERTDWMPAVDAFQRGNELVIRADVPGLTRDDLSVEIGDDAVTISGERKHEHEEEHEGTFRRERSYGRFCRIVPLPDGAVADSAKANFKDGVLEVTIQAPPKEVRRGRRIEIGQSSGQPQKK